LLLAGTTLNLIIVAQILVYGNKGSSKKPRSAAQRVKKAA
jgi:hypothetical protein